MMKTYLALSVFGVGSLLLAEPAMAQTVTDSIESVGENIVSIPTLLNYGSYILGVALGVSGVSKLRQHTENPQVPLSDGLSRLAGAAFFVSLPTALRMMQTTADVGDGTSGTYGKITALQ